MPLDLYVPILAIVTAALAVMIINHRRRCRQLLAAPATARTRSSNAAAAAAESSATTTTTAAPPTHRATGKRHSTTAREDGPAPPSPAWHSPIDVSRFWRTIRQNEKGTRNAFASTPTPAARVNADSEAEGDTVDIDRKDYDGDTESFDSMDEFEGGERMLSDPNFGRENSRREHQAAMGRVRKGWGL